jgi:LPXTG-motif cell wall-anchored protein
MSGKKERERRREERVEAGTRQGERERRQRLLKLAGLAVGESRGIRSGDRRGELTVEPREPTSRRWAALVAIASLFCLLAATPALAHEGNPNYRSEIDAVHPDPSGVSLEVLNYDADLELVDQSGHEIVIYGYEGEPYARILRDGTVQMNERSPATYLNVDRYAEVKVPPSADPKARPEWKTVDDSGTLRWHDHRSHYMAKNTPPQVTDESRRTKVFDYEIPIRVDGRKGAIDGTLFWVGPADTSKTPFLIAGLAIVILGGAAVVVVRRRREDEDGDGERPAKEAW